MPARFKRFRSLAVLAFIAFSGSVSAQQLYSDSTRIAREEHNLMMVLPDSTAVALHIDSIIQMATVYNPSILTANVFVTSWSQGPSYNFSYLRSVVLDPGYYVSSSAIISNCVFVDYVVKVPPITDSALGIAAATPSGPVMFSQGPNSANAAQRFLGIVPVV